MSDQAQLSEQAPAPEQTRASEQAHLDNGHARGQEAELGPLMSARGLGGSLLLYPNYLEIQHFGLLYLLVEFLSFHVPRLNVKILRNQITAIEIVRPILLPDYLVISYAGAPHTTGGYLRRGTSPHTALSSGLTNCPATRPAAKTATVDRPERAD